MAVNTKAIKGRIKSVGNIKKITKAMELVAAAKMRKAVDAALRTRTYAVLAWELLANLTNYVSEKMILLEDRPAERVLIVLITSNRGLCGSFNANVLKNTKALIDEKYADANIAVLAIGKKGVAFAKKHNYKVIAAFDKLSDVPRLDEVRPVAKIAIDGFSDRTYDKVVVSFTNFVSSLSQVADNRTVLPVSKETLKEAIESAGGKEAEKVAPAKELHKIGYIFEPSEVEVLETILPRLVETQIFQSVLESAASEHSSRMFAMKNANESAGDMIHDLQLSFNKARQAAITQEIAEIAGGAAALGS